MEERSGGVRAWPTEGVLHTATTADRQEQDRERRGGERGEDYDDRRPEKTEQ